MSNQKKPTSKHPAYPPPLIESATEERDARDVARTQKICDALGFSPVITETPDSYKIKTATAEQIKELLDLKAPGLSMGCTQLDDKTVRVDVDTDELERRLLLYGDVFAPAPPAPRPLTSEVARKAMATLNAFQKIADEVQPSSRNTCVPVHGASVTVHTPHGTLLSAVRIGDLKSYTPDPKDANPVARIRELSKRVFKVPTAVKLQLDFDRIEWGGRHPSQWAADADSDGSQGRSTHDVLSDLMRVLRLTEDKGTVKTPKPIRTSWDHYAKLKSTGIHVEHQQSFVREYMGADLSKTASDSTLETALRENMRKKIQRQTEDKLTELFLLSEPNYMGHTMLPIEEPPLFKIATRPTQQEEREIALRMSQAASLIENFTTRHAYVEVAQVGPTIEVTNKRELEYLYLLVREVVTCRVYTHGTFTEYAAGRDTLKVMNELVEQAIEIVYAACIHQTAQYVASTPDLFAAANDYGLRWSIYHAALASPLGLIPGVHNPIPLDYPRVAVTSQIGSEDGALPVLVIHSAHDPHFVVDLDFLKRLPPISRSWREPR